VPLPYPEQSETVLQVFHWNPLPYTGVYVGSEAADGAATGVFGATATAVASLASGVLSEVAGDAVGPP